MITSNSNKSNSFFASTVISAVLALSLTVVVITLTQTTFISAMDLSSIGLDFGTEDPYRSKDEKQMTPDEFENVLQAREESENQIVDRARSKIGTVMKPAQLINFCLNPARNIDRFELQDHAKMKENDLGLFVVDKSGSHIGVMSAGKTIIHAHPKKKYVVTEESVDEARASFPNGWKKTGPDGILKEKYAFREQMDNIMKEVQKPTAAKKQQQNGGKPAEGCSDCANNDNKKK